MASNDGRKNCDLKDLLLKEGYRFDFFQAVKLLELTRPGCASVGEGSQPEKEAVMFKSNVALGFPASDIDDISHSKGDADKYDVAANLMGLAGNFGPLPQYVTELILERLWHKDTVLKDFLDIFNHRLISIFYKARKIHRIGFEFKKPAEYKFSQYLYALMGLGTPWLKGKMKVGDQALLPYTAALNHQRRSAAGLASIVTDCFNLRNRFGMRQFIGVWQDLDDDQLTVIGRSGNNNELGVNAIAGRRFWDQQGKFRTILGALNLREYCDFLPDGRGFKPFCQLARFYTGGLIAFDISLVLKSEEVPESRLGREHGTKLGWTSWLKTKEFNAPNPEVKITSTYKTSV